MPAGEIGVVIAQVGDAAPIGAKSGGFKKDCGNFSDLETFVTNGGQKGVQRPALPPGTSAPIHPIGFLIITKLKVYGVPTSPELKRLMNQQGVLTPMSFGLQDWQLELVTIAPQPSPQGSEIMDTVGIVTTYEGEPLPSGDIASRLGGFKDVSAMEESGANDLELIEGLLGSKNNLHNNYQDYQAFLDNGGKPPSQAHNRDRQLKQTVAKSREGFVFAIDLHVQIHVPDTKAPKVISM